MADRKKYFSSYNSSETGVRRRNEFFNKQPISKYEYNKKYIKNYIKTRYHFLKLCKIYDEVYSN